MSQSEPRPNLSLHLRPRPTTHSELGWQLVMLLLLLTGCATSWEREVQYYEHAPRTILILPPMNETTAVDAGLFCVGTMIRPLIDRGYYVLPPDLTSTILRQEGIDEGMAWQVAPEKFWQYFGADAVLYVKIEKWDTTYMVVASDVTVAFSYKLVDTHSGMTLWEDYFRKSDGSKVYISRDGVSGLIASAVSAAVTALTTEYVTLAKQANQEVMFRLYPGVYHPDYPDIEQKIAAWKKQKKAEAAK